MNAAQNPCLKDIQAQCLHTKLSIGLDCKQEFTPWSREYRQLLERREIQRLAAPKRKTVLEDAQTPIPPSSRTDLGRDINVPVPNGVTKELVLEDAQTPIPPSSRTDSERSAKGWTEKYLAKGKYEHYRYCWQEGYRKKIHKLHIPKECGRLAAVEEAIKNGRSPQKIEQMIQSWRKTK